MPNTAGRQPNRHSSSGFLGRPSRSCQISNRRVRAARGRVTQPVLSNARCSAFSFKLQRVLFHRLSLTTSGSVRVPSNSRLTLLGAFDEAKTRPPCKVS